MNPQNDRHIDELVGRVMEDEAPADVQQRLRLQLAEFRDRLASADEPMAAQATTVGRRVWCTVVATAAAIGVVAVIAWTVRPQVSFADVAAAVLEQPWLHVTKSDTNGQTFKFWYSPTKDVSARREENRIEYHDHRLRVYESYDVVEKVLYRMPEYARDDADFFASMIETVRGLLRDEQLVEDPLGGLEFLGYAREDLKLVSQRLEKVEEDGQRWLDYYLTIRHRDLPDPVEILIRVERETKLPRLARVKRRREGKAVGGEILFDYPEKGPVDVYDLGVPKTAKLVDRTPPDDLARILETIRAGRQRMDDYRVLAVQCDERGGWASLPLVLYRKGDKFRADMTLGWGGVSAWYEEPPEGQDMEAWWRKRAEPFRFFPMYVTIPWKQFSVQHTAEWRNVKDPDGSLHLEIESVQKSNTLAGPGEVIPPYYSRRPEFVCRPPMGIPSQYMEPVLEMSPSEGPPGSILLHVRRTGRTRGGRARPKGLPPPPDIYRFWLDPTRDYVVVRWDMLGGGDPGSEAITHSRVIEETAKSPQGIWYATRMRRKDAITDSDGKKHDDVIHFYVDFDVDLPDSMFEPPKPGRVF